MALNEVRGDAGLALLPRRATIPPPLGAGQGGLAYQSRDPLPPTADAWAWSSAWIRGAPYLPRLSS
jgi:hypothetical protein